MKLFAILSCIAVILGAFGAHGLKPLVDLAHLESYKTGVFYHFIHALTIGIIATVNSEKFTIYKPDMIVNLFFIGIIFFSGSLYLMALGNAMGEKWSFLGPITPIGGICFIAAWVFLFLNIKIKDS